MQTIDLDVEHLVRRVQEKNILFYPVLMHLIGRSFCVVSPSEDSLKMLHVVRPNAEDYRLGHVVYDEFEAFFERYVQDCYRVMTSANVFEPTVSERTIFISYLPVGFFEIEQKSLPCFYLGSLAEDHLILSVPNWPDQLDFKQFSTLLQDFCTAF